MVPENWPQEFVYISRRLTRDIIDSRNPAASGGAGLEAINVEGVGGVSFRQPQSDRDQRFMTAREATAAIAANTGPLSKANRYIRDTLLMHACTFPLLGGWEEIGERQIGGFCASEWVDGVGRVFVGLFGSMHNFEGYSPEARETVGWSPSSAFGLYRILDAALEPEDGRVRHDLLNEDDSAVARCEMAARIFFGLSLPPAERLEVLMRPEIVESGIRLPGDDEAELAPYDLVVIGAPVWVARPDPRNRVRLRGPVFPGSEDAEPPIDMEHVARDDEPTRSGRRGLFGRRRDRPE